jgi:hypothetical protein
MGTFTVVSSSLFPHFWSQIWTLFSVGCVTLNSLERSALEEEEYVLEQKTRPAWLGEFSKVSYGLGVKNRAEEADRTHEPC